ncbi:MAG: hypothetical protein AAB726_02070, partial [Patescibacteria group bacterium]
MEKKLKSTKTKLVEAVENEVGEAEVVKKDSLMATLMADSKTPPSIGDLVEGTVIGIEKSAVYVDLP